jgi:hypothetical protein
VRVVLVAVLIVATVGLGVGVLLAGGDEAAAPSAGDVQRLEAEPVAVRAVSRLDQVPALPRRKRAPQPDTTSEDPTGTTVADPTPSAGTTPNTPTGGSTPSGGGSTGGSTGGSKPSSGSNGFGQGVAGGN